MDRPPARALLIGVVLTLLAIGCSGEESSAPATTTTTEPPPSTTTTEAPVEAGDVRYVYSPEVGDCFDRRRLEDEEGVQVVLVLDCSLPHEREVFALVTVDDALLAQVAPPQEEPPTAAGPWPGDETLGEVARLACPRSFDAWAGVAYERSELEIAWLAPDAERWAEGSRTLACTVTDGGDGRLVGSMAGSGR